MAPQRFETFMNGQAVKFTFNRGDNMYRRISITNSYRTEMTLQFMDNADVHVTIESNRDRSTSTFTANILWVNVNALEVPDLQGFIEEKLNEGPGQYQGIVLSGSGSSSRYSTALNFIRKDLDGGPVTTIKGIGIDQGWCLVGNHPAMTILGPRERNGPTKVELVLF